MAASDRLPDPLEPIAPRDRRLWSQTSYDGPANPIGAYITGLGAVIVLVAVWLPWVASGPDDAAGTTMTGYECNSTVPMVAFLGISMTVALLVASARADRRQHRGLSLTSMAIGLAWALFTVTFYLRPPAGASGGALRAQYGLLVSLCGALVWTLGSYLLAREPEGDYQTLRGAPLAAAATDGNDREHTPIDADVTYPLPGPSRLPPPEGRLTDRGLLDDSGDASGYESSA